MRFVHRNTDLDAEDTSTAVVSRFKHVFLCRKLVSKLCFLFKKCENNFLLEIALKWFFEARG